VAGRHNKHIEEHRHQIAAHTLLSAPHVPYDVRDAIYRLHCLCCFPSFPASWKFPGQTWAVDLTPLLDVSWLRILHVASSSHSSTASSLNTSARSPAAVAKPWKNNTHTNELLVWDGGSRCTGGLHGARRPVMQRDRVRRLANSASQSQQQAAETLAFADM